MGIFIVAGEGEEEVEEKEGVGGGGGVEKRGDERRGDERGDDLVKERVGWGGMTKAREVETSNSRVNRSCMLVLLTGTRKKACSREENREK